MEQITPNQRDCQVAPARTLANKSWILRQAMGTKSLAEFITIAHNTNASAELQKNQVDGSSRF